MGDEEKIDGVGVEFLNDAPENEPPLDLQPLVVDAVEVEDSRTVEDARPAPAAPAPDFYAVGVRLIKMSPVWLLTVTGGFAFLILLLSWVRPAGGEADAASIPNDAKPVAAQQQRQQAPPAAAAKPSPETRAALPAPAKEARPEVAQEARAPEPSKAAPTPAPSEPARAEQKAKPAATADEAGGKFTVQVGSFSVESQANERISSLRASGFDARSTAVQIPGRGVWYRVQVGRFREREEAAKAAAQLREKGAAASSMVVPVQ
jgi:cell division septation protein DedD